MGFDGEVCFSGRITFQDVILYEAHIVDYEAVLAFQKEDRTHQRGSGLVLFGVYYQVELLIRCQSFLFLGDDLQFPLVDFHCPHTTPKDTVVDTIHVRFHIFPMVVVFQVNHE